jgi:hypothetical protein
MQKLPYLRSPNMAFEFFGRHEERENKKGKGEERRSKKDLPWAEPVLLFQTHAVCERRVFR